MNTVNLSHLRHIAEAAAMVAGRQLKESQADWGGIELELGRDVEVKADKLAEKIILTQLQAASPYPILTEETGWHGDSNQPIVWVVDPLDGSFNYHQNIPFCCVAIALTIQGEPRIGVVYDFNHDELFAGITGEGAWLNGQPIHVSTIDKLESAVLNTGFPSRQNMTHAVETMIKRGLPYRKVRMLGSAALALAYVAVGRADTYLEEGTLFWDVAAGCALVRAAGGVCELTGDIFNAPLKAFASNGKLPAFTSHK